MSKFKDMPSLAPAELSSASGGMRGWEQWRHSYGVEDHSPGAPPIWKQKINTFIHNWRKGYWY